MQLSERLYYNDAFLAEFQATVTEVREEAGGEGAPRLLVALDRTAFYPTSGGQPFDTGTLTARDAGVTERLVAVEETAEDEQGQIWHRVEARLEPGAAVDGRIDWGRRFDHMQQHTGQHLLSAVFQRELGAATVSFHLGESSSTIDLATGALDAAALERVERLANEVIAEDRRVSPAVVSREEAERMLDGGELRKLPPREGAIRVIEIERCDRNACGGTHVRSTGQIGGLLLRRVEKVSRGVRVEFVCGQRAVRTARADAAVLTETAGLLSTGAAELAATVRRLQAEAKVGAKERQRLREELAALQGERLAAEAPEGEGLRVLERAWGDRDQDFVRLLASRTAAAGERLAVVFSSGEVEPVRVFLARSRDAAPNCGQILRQCLGEMGLRGGGSADLAQGDVPREREAELRDRVREALLGTAGGGA